MKHKYIRIIFFVIATIFLNNSCDNSTGPLQNSNWQQNFTVKKPKKEIKMVGQWYKQGAREKMLRDFVSEYNFKNQETEIVITFLEEIEGYNAIDLYLAKQFQKPQPDWDILLLNNSYFLEVGGEPDWPQKYLVDFSEFPEFVNNTIPELISDSIKKLWHGIIPGPFVEGFTYTLWSNKNVAHKVGIEVKQIGMTFDDLYSYIKAVSEYNNKNPNDYIIPILEGGDWKTLHRMFNQLYVSELNDINEYFRDQVSEKKLNAWYNTLKAFEKLSAYQPLHPRWDTTKWGKITHLMLEDKCLFYSNGSWLYNHWQNMDTANKLKNIMPTEYPVFRPTPIYIGGYQILWGVPKNAPNKDEAIKFLLALNNSKFAERWVRDTKSPTGIKGKLAKVSMGLDHFENYNVKINEKYGRNKIIYSGNQMLFSKAGEKISNYGHEVLQRKMTPEEAMERIRKNLHDNKIQIKR